MRQVVKPYIRVNSFVEQKVVPIVVKRPDVGIRWGKPSKFDFSNQGKEGKKSTDVFTVKNERDAKDKTVTFDFTGEATQYNLTPDATSPLQGFVRFTSRLVFTGNVKFEQYKDGRRQLPLNVKYVYDFRLTLNEDII